MTHRASLEVYDDDDPEDDPEELTGPSQLDLFTAFEVSQRMVA